jgi:hypothetical protein
MHRDVVAEQVRDPGRVGGAAEVVKQLDFETTIPEAVENLVRGR